MVGGIVEWEQRPSFLHIGQGRLQARIARGFAFARSSGRRQRLHRRKPFDRRHWHRRVLYIWVGSEHHPHLRRSAAGTC